MQRALVSFGRARSGNLTRLRYIYVTGGEVCHNVAASSSAVQGHSSGGPTLAFRHFASRRVVAFPLAQTGEGISECELVAWSVKVRPPQLGLRRTDVSRDLGAAGVALPQCEGGTAALGISSGAMKNCSTLV